MHFNLFFILTLALILEPWRALAGYPGALWSSARMPSPLVGVRVGQITNDFPLEVATLSLQQLTLYQIRDHQLTKLLEYKGEHGSEWMKLNLFDVDGDGVSEIIISGFVTDRPHSWIMQLQGNQLKIIQEVEFYLNILPWQGQEILVGQKGFGGAAFTGPLLQLKWDGKNLIQAGEIALPGKLLPEAMSLYSLYGWDVQDRRGFLFLSDTARLYFFERDTDKWKRSWASGANYGGPVVFLDRETRNILNQVETTRFFVPLKMASNRWLPRRWHPPLVAQSTGDGRQSTANQDKLYLVKNEGYLKKIVGAVPTIKTSQMVRLNWTGYGFQEDWSSVSLDGAIADFDLVDWDGDGVEEILAILLLRDHGYFDTLKKQDSLLLVLKP